MASNLYRYRITEKTVLFISVLKWFVLATVIGILTGFVCTLYLKLLNLSIDFTEKYQFYYFGIPLVFVGNTLLAKYLLKDSAGEGTDKVIEAIHKSSGDMKWYLVPFKLLANISTLAFGGSTGKEGPAAEAGGALAAAFAKLFRFDANDRKKLVICGISAGFASVFGTPIGGAIFGVEVLFIGSLLYDVLFPSFIAGIVSYQVSSSFGIQYFRHKLNFVPVFSELFFLKVMAAGIFFGLCSIAFIELLNFFEQISRKIKVAPVFKNIGAGFVLILLTLLFSNRFLGLGLNHIESSLEGGKAAGWVFPMKMLFTAITLNFGGSGGIVTPIFFVGSTAGAFFARLIHGDGSTFAAIGMVSVLAGCTNTPIASSIMGIELFGSQIAPYAAVASTISFLLTGHTSVFSSQILAIRKSPSLEVELGKEIEGLEKIESQILVRKNSLFALIWRFFVFFKARLSHLRNRKKTTHES
jgi:H+/Cl- antiporter ClcA